MSKIKLVVTAAALVLSVTVLAGGAERTEGQAPVLDPRAFPNLTQIYVASGVLDGGGAANTSSATVILCTNFTANTQQIRYLVRDLRAAVVANITIPIGGLVTITAATHLTAAFLENLELSPGTIIAQGSLRIFATAPQITCTVQVIDAASATPIGVPLHMVRHNAWPGTQE